MRLAADTLGKVVASLARLPQPAGLFYRTPRVGVRATVTVVPYAGATAPPAFEARVNDVGDDGVSLEYGAQVQVGRQLSIHIPTSGRRRPMQLLCTVTHCRPTVDGRFIVSAEYGASGIDTMTHLMARPIVRRAA